MAVGSPAQPARKLLNDTSWVHQLPPQTKVVALVGFVCCVVATPTGSYWPFLGQFGVLVLVAAVAGLAPGRLLRALAVEVPFVAFALAMPFLATGPTTSVLGWQLSVAGLHGAVMLLAKSTLSVLAALILAATTEPPEFVSGLQRLRLPALMVEILGFMIRYLGLIAAQWRRMAIARVSRGFEGRNLRAWPALSGAVGSGFIRSYERGERVHLAMLARGYDGEMPAALGSSRSARPIEWAVAAGLVCGTAILSWWLR